VQRQWRREEAHEKFCYGIPLQIDQDDEDEDDEKYAKELQERVRYLFAYTTVAIEQELNKIEDIELSCSSAFDNLPGESIANVKEEEEKRTSEEVDSFSPENTSAEDLAMADQTRSIPLTVSNQSTVSSLDNVVSVGIVDESHTAEETFGKEQQPPLHAHNISRDSAEGENLREPPVQPEDQHVSVSSSQDGAVSNSTRVSAGITSKKSYLSFFSREKPRGKDKSSAAATDDLGAEPEAPSSPSRFDPAASTTTDTVASMDNGKAVLPDKVSTDSREFYAPELGRGIHANPESSLLALGKTEISSASNERATGTVPVEVDRDGEEYAGEDSSVPSLVDAPTGASQAQSTSPRRPFAKKRSSAIANRTKSRPRNQSDTREASVLEQEGLHQMPATEEAEELQHRSQESKEEEFPYTTGGSNPLPPGDQHVSVSSSQGVVLSDSKRATAGITGKKSYISFFTREKPSGKDKKSEAAIDEPVSIYLAAEPSSFEPAELTACTVASMDNGKAVLPDKVSSNGREYHAPELGRGIHANPESSLVALGKTEISSANNERATGMVPVELDRDGEEYAGEDSPDGKLHLTPAPSLVDAPTGASQAQNTSPRRPFAKKRSSAIVNRTKSRPRNQSDTREASVLEQEGLHQMPATEEAEELQHRSQESKEEEFPYTTGGSNRTSSTVAWDQTVDRPLHAHNILRDSAEGGNLRKNPVQPEDQHVSVSSSQDGVVSNSTRASAGNTSKKSYLYFFSREKPRGKDKSSAVATDDLGAEPEAPSSPSRFDPAASTTTDTLFSNDNGKAVQSDKVSTDSCEFYAPERGRCVHELDGHGEEYAGEDSSAPSLVDAPTGASQAQSTSPRRPFAKKRSSAIANRMKSRPRNQSDTREASVLEQEGLHQMPATEEAEELQHRSQDSKEEEFAHTFNMFLLNLAAPCKLKDKDSDDVGGSNRTSSTVAWNQAGRSLGIADDSSDEDPASIDESEDEIESIQVPERDSRQKKFRIPDMSKISRWTAKVFKRTSTSAEAVKNIDMKVSLCAKDQAPMRRTLSSISDDDSFDGGRDGLEIAAADRDHSAKTVRHTPLLPKMPLVPDNDSSIIQLGADAGGYGNEEVHPFAVASAKECERAKPEAERVDRSRQYFTRKSQSIARSSILLSHAAATSVPIDGSSSTVQDTPESNRSESNAAAQELNDMSERKRAGRKPFSYLRRSSQRSSTGVAASSAKRTPSADLSNQETLLSADAEAGRGGPKNACDGFYHEVTETAPAGALRPVGPFEVGVTSPNAAIIDQADAFLDPQQLVEPSQLSDTIFPVEDIDENMNAILDIISREVMQPLLSDHTKCSLPAHPVHDEAVPASKRELSPDNNGSTGVEDMLSFIDIYKHSFLGSQSSRTLDRDDVAANCDELSAAPFADFPDCNNVNSSELSSPYVHPPPLLSDRPAVLISTAVAFALHSEPEIDLSDDVEDDGISIDERNEDALLAPMDIGGSQSATGNVWEGSADHSDQRFFKFVEDANDDDTDDDDDDDDDVASRQRTEKYANGLNMVKEAFSEELEFAPDAALGSTMSSVSIPLENHPAEKLSSTPSEATAATTRSHEKHCTDTETVSCSTLPSACSNAPRVASNFASSLLPVPPPPPPPLLKTLDPPDKAASRPLSDPPMPLKSSISAAFALYSVLEDDEESDELSVSAENLFTDVKWIHENQVIEGKERPVAAERREENLLPPLTVDPPPVSNDFARGPPARAVIGSAAESKAAIATSDTQTLPSSAPRVASRRKSVAPAGPPPMDLMKSSSSRALPPAPVAPASCTPLPPPPPPPLLKTLDPPDKAASRPLSDPPTPLNSSISAAFALYSVLEDDEESDELSVSAEKSLTDMKWIHAAERCEENPLPPLTVDPPPVSNDFSDGPPARAVIGSAVESKATSDTQTLPSSAPRVASRRKSVAPAGPPPMDLMKSSSSRALPVAPASCTPLPPPPPPPLLKTLDPPDKAASRPLSDPPTPLKSSISAAFALYSVLEDDEESDEWIRDKERPVTAGRCEENPLPPLTVDPPPVSNDFSRGPPARAVIGSAAESKAAIAASDTQTLPSSAPRVASRRKSVAPAGPPPMDLMKSSSSRAPPLAPAALASCTPLPPPPPRPPPPSKRGPVDNSDGQSLRISPPVSPLVESVSNKASASIFPHPSLILEEPFAFPPPIDAPLNLIPQTEPTAHFSWNAPTPTLEFMQNSVVDATMDSMIAPSPPPRSPVALAPMSPHVLNPESIKTPLTAKRSALLRSRPAPPAPQRS
jgi:hypothetical protein